MYHSQTFECVKIGIDESGMANASITLLIGLLYFMWSPLVKRKLSTTFYRLYSNHHISPLHVTNSWWTSVCSFHLLLYFSLKYYYTIGHEKGRQPVQKSSGRRPPVEKGRMVNADQQKKAVIDGRRRRLPFSQSTAGSPFHHALYVAKNVA